MEENKNIEDGQIVEEVKKPNNLLINFSTSDKTSVLEIKEDDIHKLARVFYDFCLDHKIDVTLELKDNN